MPLTCYSFCPLKDISPLYLPPQDLNPEVDKPGKRKKLDATARGGSEDKEAPPAIDFETTESTPLQPAGGGRERRGEFSWIKSANIQITGIRSSPAKVRPRRIVLSDDSLRGTC